MNSYDRAHALLERLRNDRTKMKHPRYIEHEANGRIYPVLPSLWPWWARHSAFLRNWYAYGHPEKFPFWR